MESGMVEWPVPPSAPRGEAAEAGGLRERKKRLMRQQLSDTATRMFMERGFDGVRVTEIAEACGVSEKTVPAAGADTSTASTPRPNRIAAVIAATLAEDIRSSATPESWPAILEELRRQLGLQEQQ